MNGKMKVLKWLVALTAGIMGASTAAATGVLGTPVDGTVVSGVGVISGYHCTSKDIEVFIDGVSLGKAGAGTQLLGTQGVCGRTDTGFSLLYNFNNLPNGQHTFSVYADGVLFDQHTVTTFQSGGIPWLSGKSAVYTLPDFPAAGQTATVQWVQSYQNFLITSISGTPTTTPPPPTNDMSDLVGTYNQTVYISSVGSGCGALAAFDGYYTSSFNITKNSDTLTVISYTTNGVVSDSCQTTLNKISGDSVSGYNSSGSQICASGFNGSVSATGFKKDGSKVVGTMIKSGLGCTQTVILE